MTKKNGTFEGWSWFKFNNFVLTLGKNLKIYTSVAKRLKLKVRVGLKRTQKQKKSLKKIKQDRKEQEGAEAIVKGWELYDFFVHLY